MLLVTVQMTMLFKLYVYDLNTNCWDQLPPPGCYFGIPQIVGGKLVIFGGHLSDNYKAKNLTKCELSTELPKIGYPIIPTCCQLEASMEYTVATYLEHVIVAGGDQGEGDKFSTQLKMMISKF